MPDINVMETKEQSIELNNGVLEQTKFLIFWYSSVFLQRSYLRKEEIQDAGNLISKLNNLQLLVEKENKRLYNELN